MGVNNGEWNPASSQSWARALGLIEVPLFGRTASAPSGSHAVLLDGQRASFSLSIVDSFAAATSDNPLAWAWSANLPHTLIADTSESLLFLRRWDAPERLRKFRFPDKVKGAVDLLGIIESEPPQTGPDVVTHLLRAFRALREELPREDALTAVRLFNAFLAATESANSNKIERKALLKCETVADLLALLAPPGAIDPGLLGTLDLAEIPEDAKRTALGAIPSLFLLPEPRHSYSLDPSLLLRHASGQLFQEAHLAVEQETQRRLFVGIGGDEPPHGTPKLGVRFTPPTLVRALVEESLKAGTADTDRLDICDPACGSGVFLIEALRALTNRQYAGLINLKGFDISPLSRAMARFCVHHAKIDAEAQQSRVHYDISEEDSLQVDWGMNDVILMNPPFIPIDQMEQGERAAVATVLGELAKGRYDKAMAFVYKGVQSLKAGGSLATVLPAALLETSSGVAWRKAISQLTQISLIGRFEGFGYFRASMVEPAFVVVRKVGPAPQVKRRVTLVLAKGAAEDSALRGLRLKESSGGDQISNDWEVYESLASSLRPSSWLPRSSGNRKLIERLESASFPKVGSLFEVNQGARTGDNKAFILSASDFSKLRPTERKFFRPAAGSSSIENGQLLPLEYVFFPYDAHGLILATEDDLESKVPTYFDNWLKPNRNDLIGRPRIGAEIWWRLSEHRAWQRTRKAKLVSTYFGQEGSFAYDETGDYAVVQGFGWKWKRNLTEDLDDDEDGPEQQKFSDTILPWAYLALLNSLVFSRLLAFVCPRVQGGQFNLSSRFIKQVFLPDLSDTLRITGEIVQDLAAIGKKIHSGKSFVAQELNDAAARAYGFAAGEIIATT